MPRVRFHDAQGLVASLRSLSGGKKVYIIRYDVLSHTLSCTCDAHRFNPSAPCKHVLRYRRSWLRKFAGKRVAA